MRGEQFHFVTQRSIRAIAVLTLLCASLVGAQPHASDAPEPPAQDPPASATPTEPAPSPTAPAAAPTTAPATKSGATVKGKLPIVPRKRPQVKEYGAQPAIKVEPPDVSMSVVWIGSGFPPIDGNSVPARTITQSGYQFRPEVTVIQSGTRVSFPNNDENYHSVFSLSDRQQFDVGRFVKGEEPAAKPFMTPGVVDLFCDVHDHMRGHIIVTDTPWFARSDEAGQFEIAGIAPGKHSVRIWVGPRRKLIEKEVELQEGQVLEVDWSSIDGSPSK